jgi:hypothetical protein
VGLEYLSIWTDEDENHDSLADAITHLFSSSSNGAYLIYEQIEGRAHHSEKLVDARAELPDLAMQIAQGSQFKVLSDLRNFVVVPIAANEVVIIHNGEMTAWHRASVKVKDSTDTYRDGDQFAFISPELDVIAARST